MVMSHARLPIPSSRRISHPFILSRLKVVPNDVFSTENLRPRRSDRRSYRPICFFVIPTREGPLARGQPSFVQANQAALLTDQACLAARGWKPHATIRKSRGDYERMRFRAQSQGDFRSAGRDFNPRRWRRPSTRDATRFSRSDRRSRGAKGRPGSVFVFFVNSPLRVWMRRQRRCSGQPAASG